MVSEELQFYGRIHFGKSRVDILIDRLHGAQANKSSVSTAIKDARVRVPLQVLPSCFAYVALRIKHIVLAVMLVSPLIVKRVGIYVIEVRRASGCGHLVSTLQNLVPKDASLLLSTHADVVGALGDPRMIVDNNCGHFKSGHLSVVLFSVDTQDFSGFVGVFHDRLAGYLLVFLAVNWGFMVPARTDLSLDVGAALGRSNLVSSIAE